ncbi:MAG: hypothetical protein K9H49_14870 [Bacteroidales bacterium]|nr:hypothetical protein [Bacteroidales bacterium]MCF8390628.1 hypothetical protein [Bacteroidales bacterium]
MKTKLINFTIILFLFTLNSCKQNEEGSDMKIIFLHHSTGGVIWNGNKTSTLSWFVGKISYRLSKKIEKNPRMPALFNNYNKKHKKNYYIKEMDFPKATPYGWENNPYDYYNIWVKNAGEEPFMKEPTLEMLTKEYQLVIFKHCFPVCNIQEDLDSADINSDLKTISNYKLQYSALRDKMHEFPDTKFILFTGAAQVKSRLTEAEAKRAREFFSWVRDEWDQAGDNIYLWDLYSLETEGSLYFKDEYAVSPSDSHPNKDFAGNIVNLLFNRIIDVIDNNGNNTQVTGKEN